MTRSENEKEGRPLMLKHRRPIRSMRPRPPPLDETEHWRRPPDAGMESLRLAVSRSSDKFTLFRESDHGVESKEIPA